jgi:uncharacterized protein
MFWDIAAATISDLAIEVRSSRESDEVGRRGYFPKHNHLTLRPKSSIFSLMISGLIRIIFYALLFYIIYLLYLFFKGISKASKASQVKKQPSGMMVKDEICNTYLPKEDTLKEVIEGKEYYFCSKECRDKFLEQKKKDS